MRALRCNDGHKYNAHSIDYTYMYMAIFNTVAHDLIPDLS